MDGIRVRDVEEIENNTSYVAARRNEKFSDVPYGEMRKPFVNAVRPKYKECASLL